MRLRNFIPLMLLFFLFLACDAEKEAIQRRSLLMPKSTDLPRNSKFVEYDHSKRNKKMAKKMKRYKKRNKKHKYAGR